MYTIAALTAAFKVDGHRADIVILKTARAQAAYEGRTASPTGILLAAELALPHRMKKQPFHHSELTPTNCRNASSSCRVVHSGEPSEAEKNPEANGKKKVITETGEQDNPDQPPDAEPRRSKRSSARRCALVGRRKKVKVGETFEPRNSTPPWIN